VIELESVSVRRGAALVLDRLTLSLGDGVAALIGPSGAGKTTLLRVLLGLEAPSDGSVRLGGRVVSRAGSVDVLPEYRNVAMVFQDLALWPHLSVHGNLAYGLRARGVGKAERERRIARALSSVGLEGMACRRPGELSGGERQRVAIARALVLDPMAILLDEPLGSLDVVLKEDLLGLFGRVFHELRVPVIYVTHDPFEAARLAERIVVLEGGRVVQDGTLAELAAMAATPFVGAFSRLARHRDE
jgi:iron(III) transport system ATP-binding protein